MQLVAVELCARRILPLAIDDVAQAQSGTASRNAVKPRMSRLRCRTTIARHAGRAKAKLQPRDAWSVAEARRGVLEIKALFLCGLDVVSHRPRFVLHFVHAVLHDVADRDNADEPALIDHRHVAKLPVVIRSMMLETASPSLQVSTFRVIVRLTGRSSAATPPSANPRTTSRSEMIPAMRWSAPRMRAAPMCLSARSRAASPSVAPKSMVTTSRPLRARIMPTVIVASLTPWMRRECDRSP